MDEKKQGQIADWIGEEAEALKKHDVEFMEGRGYKPFYLFSKGVTSFSIDTGLKPRDTEVDRVTKKIFRIEVKGEQYDWSLNVRNPIYREIITRLAEGTTLFTLLRSGDGAETKYELMDEREKLQ